MCVCFFYFFLFFLTWHLLLHNIFCYRTAYYPMSTIRACHMSHYPYTRVYMKTYCFIINWKRVFQSSIVLTLYRVHRIVSIHDKVYFLFCLEMLYLHPPPPELIARKSVAKTCKQYGRLTLRRYWYHNHRILLNKTIENRLLFLTVG